MRPTLDREDKKRTLLLLSRVTVVPAEYEEQKSVPGETVASRREYSRVNLKRQRSVTLSHRTIDAASPRIVYKRCPRPAQVSRAPVSRGIPSRTS